MIVYLLPVTVACLGLQQYQQQLSFSNQNVITCTPQEKKAPNLKFNQISASKHVKINKLKRMCKL